MNIQDQILLDSWEAYIKNSKESKEEMIQWAVSKLSRSYVNSEIFLKVLRMIEN
jgi:hypothetical protein